MIIPWPWAFEDTNRDRLCFRPCIFDFLTICYTSDLSCVSVYTTVYVISLLLQRQTYNNLPTIYPIFCAKGGNFKMRTLKKTCPLIISLI